MEHGLQHGNDDPQLVGAEGRAQADLPCASLDPERHHGVDAGERKEDREGFHPRDDGGGQRQLQHQRATDLVEWKDLVEAQSGSGRLGEDAQARSEQMCVALTSPLT